MLSFWTWTLAAVIALAFSPLAMKMALSVGGSPLQVALITALSAANRLPAVSSGRLAIPPTALPSSPRRVNLTLPLVLFVLFKTCLPRCVFVLVFWCLEFRSLRDLTPL